MKDRIKFIYFELQKKSHKEPGKSRISFILFVPFVFFVVINSSKGGNNE